MDPTRRRPEPVPTAPADGAHEPGLLRRLRTVEELEAAIKDGSFEYLPIATGPADALLAQFALGAVQVQIGIERTVHAWRGALEAGRFGIAMPAPGSTPSRWNGGDWSPGTLAAYGAGHEQQIRLSGPLTWCAFTFPAALLPALGAEANTRRDGCAGPVGLFRSPPAMQALLAELVGLARREPAALVPAVGRAFEQALLDALRAALGAPATEARRALATRRRYRRHVEHALHEIDRRVGEPIYTAELCAALGVSERMLHQAFAAVYGMSVHRVLKRRRLMLVRRALLDPDAGRSVKSAALRFGFWHLGRLSAEYRAQFGEFPADTLRRRQSGAGHSGTTGPRADFD